MMALRRYIVDASVAVKWLSHRNEPHLAQADDLLTQAVRSQIRLLTSDPCIYEVLNALVRGKQLRASELARAIEIFLALPMDRLAMTRERAHQASQIAAEYRLTVYDAIYIVLAIECAAPLITVNVRHQGKVARAPVIDIASWPIRA